MVSMNPNPSQGFYSFDSMNLNHLPIVESLPPPQSAILSSDCATTTSFLEDSNKKIRKPYTITNSRENWTEQEHDKFLEALQLFDRDWKKIEAFVGSKTVIQIRSHAQKYFLKIQKSGKREHVPPPRPKKKASHPYPQKAPKNTTSQKPVLYQPLSSTFETRCIDVPESSAAFGHPESSATLSSWSSSSVPMVTGSQVPTDGVKFAGSTTARNYSYSSNNVSTPQTWQTGEISRADQSNIFRVMPDFAQIYSFIGSVFDPSVSDHLQRLRQMDPINLETALLLMQNLAINLTSPEFENHRRVLSLYDEDLKKAKYGGGFGNNICGVRSENTILSA